MFLMILYKESLVFVVFVSAALITKEQERTCKSDDFPVVEENAMLQ